MTVEVKFTVILFREYGGDDIVVTIHNNSKHKDRATSSVYNVLETYLYLVHTLHRRVSLWTSFNVDREEEFHGGSLPHYKRSTWEGRRDIPGWVITHVVNRTSSPED